MSASLNPLRYRKTVTLRTTLSCCFVPTENLGGPSENRCCGQLSFHSGIHTVSSEKGYLPFVENSAEEFNQPSYCVNVLGLVRSCVQYA